MKHGLQEWGRLSSLDIHIPKETDNLFCERIPLGHPPRILAFRDQAVSSNVYRFFDPESPCVPETDHLLSCGIPFDMAQRINKINNHPRGLSLLGILPNQIRSLLKLCGQEADVATDEISMKLFEYGYKIWTSRKKRNNHFWKNIAPVEWKASYKGHGRTQKKKIEQKIIVINVETRSTFLLNIKVYQVSNRLHAVALN